MNLKENTIHTLCGKKENKILFLFRETHFWRSNECITMIFRKFFVQFLGNLFIRFIFLDSISSISSFQMLKYENLLAMFRSKYSFSSTKNPSYQLKYKNQSLKIFHDKMLEKAGDLFRDFSD